MWREGGREKLDKSFSENEIFMIFNHKRAGGERERVIRGGWWDDENGNSIQARIFAAFLFFALVSWRGRSLKYSIHTERASAHNPIKSVGGLSLLSIFSITFSMIPHSLPVCCCSSKGLKEIRNFLARSLTLRTVVDSARKIAWIENESTEARAKKAARVANPISDIGGVFWRCHQIF